MDGVTILNQYEVVSATRFSWPCFWIAFVVIAIFVAIVAFAAVSRDHDWKTALIICAIAIPIAAGSFGALSGKVISPEPVEYETRYEVSVDDTVSMQEFYEKYEVIEQRGKIFVVREAKE